MFRFFLESEGVFRLRRLEKYNVANFVKKHVLWGVTVLNEIKVWWIVQSWRNFFFNKKVRETKHPQEDLPVLRWMCVFFIYIIKHSNSTNTPDVGVNWIRVAQKWWKWRKSVLRAREHGNQCENFQDFWWKQGIKLCAYLLLQKQNTKAEDKWRDRYSGCGMYRSHLQNTYLGQNSGILFITIGAS